MCEETIFLQTPFTNPPIHPSNYTPSTHCLHQTTEGRVPGRVCTPQSTSARGQTSDTWDILVLQPVVLGSNRKIFTNVPIQTPVKLSLDQNRRPILLFDTRTKNLLQSKRPVPRTNGSWTMERTPWNPRRMHKRCIKLC